MILGAKLRRLLWRLRRGATDFSGAVLTVAGAALMADHWFPDLRSRQAELGPVLVASSLAALVVSKLVARLRMPSTPQREPSPSEEARNAKADVDLGCALLVACYVMLQMTGGLRSPMYPLVYAVVAFVATFHRTSVALPLVAISAGLEFLLAGGEERPLMYSHLAFIGFFALVHLLFLQAELLRQRREHRASIAREIRSLREEARDFRLISASLAHDPRRSREADQERLAIGAVETIHEAIFYTIELLKKSLELHTCILLWLDESG